MKKTLLAATAALALLNCAPACAATFQVVKDYNSIITMVGEILPGDDERFAEVVLQQRGKGITPTGLVLQSPGGQLDVAVKLTDAVHQLGIATAVGPEGACESVCVLIYAAGARRIAYSNSRLAVHSISELQPAAPRKGKGKAIDKLKAPTSKETANSMAGTVALARMFAFLKVPMPIIGKMVATPGAEMTVLDADDLAAWNVEILKPESN